MRTALGILILVVLTGVRMRAQGFQTVFPNLSGAELIDSVASHYRPNDVLDYANARDTLYGKILSADDDSIRCIYSGHTLYIDHTQDPTQWIYQNGGTNGMNTEHAYPQSKGAADGNAHSDMHHLFPARVQVNEYRSDLPYAEIPDAQTQKWFINNQVVTSEPTKNKDAYAEYKSGAFEPRELSKGDVARAVFYFYTMYRAQADLADPAFFELQRPTLCQWAQQDPADSAELIKTWRIAPYQDGKPNPFVIDCTLASRCWCPGVAPGCLSETHTPGSPVFALEFWPNPAFDEVALKLQTTAPAVISVYNFMGTQVYQAPLNPENPRFSVAALPQGVYLAVLQSEGKTYSGKLLVEN